MKTVTPEVKLAQVEDEVLEFWKSEKIFEESNRRREQAKEFTFYDGPPFANGLPHYGHLLANTIKDSVPRYWNMRGYRVERRFGWDCHGFPVESEIEKNNKLIGSVDILKFGVAKFNEECRKSVKNYVHHWQETITRLGRWVDWNNQYHTMDKDFMESVWWVFAELYKKGLIYQDHKIVSYSPQNATVVSNFEANQNYKDVQDPAVTVKCKVKDEPNTFLLIWTTTPWTLIANLAVAVSPTHEYVKIKDHQTNEFYYLAKARLDGVYKKKPNEDAPYTIIEELGAAKLRTRSYEPLFPYYKDHVNAFQVLVDDYVTVDDGTGIVHQAPAFGEDDFRVCRAHHIKLVDPLDLDGRYTNEIPEYEGLFVKDADKEIIKALKEKGLLLRNETIVHSYPFCDRTDTPLIYRAIPAWYVKVESFRDAMVKNNQSINWVPLHLRDGRMGKWLENARDWAISRNRFWGTPLPVWLCESDAKCLKVLGSVAELEKLSGKKVDDLHKHFIDDLTFPCDTCGSTMRRIPEVLDCWFESGAMPYAQKHYPFENQKEFANQFPADFIAEGLDQTRGWFYTLSVLSEALFHSPAFKNVVVNGIICDDTGKKMSKRHRNYTPPMDLINEFGADSVRLYMLNSPLLKGENLIFKTQGVRDVTRAAILPLWNAHSFLTTYAKADGWVPDENSLNGKMSSQNILDHWILSKLQTVTKQVHVQMEGYHLYAVIPELLSFIEDLTNWYIRLSRRRFWTGEPGAGLSEDTRSAYSTLYFVLAEFSKLFAPFAPFISDRIYQNLTDSLKGSPKSVHLCDMPEVRPELVQEELEKRMKLVRTAAELGRSLRAKHQIKTRQPLREMLVITRDKSGHAAISENQSLIASELNVKTIAFSDNELKYVSVQLKPNLKTLGRRLGKDLAAFRQELDRLNAANAELGPLMAKLETEGSVSILGQSFVEEDFLIERGPKGAQLIATEGGVTVLLDTHLTDDLLSEGLAREVVNRVQNFRKDSGLNVSDRIVLGIATSPELSAAINEYKDYISSETLAVDLKLQNQLSGFTHKTDFDIDNMNCTIAMSVAKY